MLLSLLKILIFFALVLAIALGAMQLSEFGRPLYLVYDGTEYMLGPIQQFVALALLFVTVAILLFVLGLLLAVLRFVAGDETAISRYFARSRVRKGYDALAEGMLAIASGEGKLAQDKAAKAARYLDKPHVTDVLAAQAAEVAGDTTKATEAYRRLLGDDRTRFVGIRGLMRQKLVEGDTATALLLAEKAYALKPKHRELQDTLLDLQTTEGDWKGARQIVKEKRRQGQLPQDVAIRRDAVLALQEAKDVLAEGNSISAREAAITANKASPDLIPAAVLAAKSYIAQKDPRNAMRVLQKTWSVRPHPSLAATYAEIVPDETPVERLKRFEQLIRQNPDHEESHLLRAELLLAAEDFPGARRALGDLAQTHPTVRTLSTMAAVERGEGADDAVVRGWLAKALTASRGPQWVCDKCHNVMAEWAPVCDSCGGFDTLTWREPDERRMAVYAATNGAEMLPLLVGSSTASAASRDHREADAPSRTDLSAEPLEPGLVGDEPVAPPPPNPPERPIEVANVAPGMVPRESDYAPDAAMRTDRGRAELPERVMTVTDPEPATPAGVKAATASAIPTASGKPKDPRFVDESDFAPVRPDVEPIDPDFLEDGKKSR